MVPSSEGLSNVVGPSSSTKKPKWFKIKKWNATHSGPLISPPLTFRYRTGKEKDSSSSSSGNGYFAEQALRDGFGIGSSSFIPPPMSRTEALQEELRRERIREELLAREIVQKRMLEDIRRELEIERLMAMRRLEEERFLPKAMEMEGRVGFGVRERLGTGFLLEDERSPPSLGMLPRFREDIGMDKMPTPPRFGDVGYLDKPPVPRKSMVGKMELSKLLSKPGVSSSKDGKNGD